MDLEHNGDDDIHQDENHDSVKRKEEYFDVPRPASDGTAHVDDNEPVVDYHLLEHDYKGGAKVIEIHQIVQSRDGCSYLIFIDSESELAVEENHSDVCILIEHQVDEEEPVQDGLREVGECLPDELNILDHPGVLQKSSVPQGEEYSEVLQLMSHLQIIRVTVYVVNRVDEIAL